MLRKIPLGTVGVVIGLVLTLLGFWAYATDRPTLNLAGFFYGIPLLLGGLALKSAELKPVPNEPIPSAEVLALREQWATSTQNQVRKDVTRFRYGEEGHLVGALESLGLSPNDDQRPVLQKIREEVRAGHYALVLTFDSPHIDLEAWRKKQDRIARFFGPNLGAEIQSAEPNQIELVLISTQNQAAAAV